MKRWVMLLMMSVVVFGCVQSHQSQTISGAETSDAVEGRGTHTDKWWHALPREEWASFERVLPEQTWFEVYRVLPQVYAIYEPHQFEEVISFLVIGRERALLFDTGLGVARLQPVIAQLTERQVVVVNSHSHYDHVGGNHEFDHIQAADDAFARERQSGLDARDVGEYVSGDWMARPIPDGIDVSNYAIKPYRISAYLNDGDSIDLGGVTFEVVRTPGHTPDSLCLLDRERRMLLTGDTFYLAPLYMYSAESNYADYRRSAQRLATLAPEVDVLLMGHNVPMASSEYLLALQRAFEAMDAGTTPYVETDGAYEYTFEGFSVIAPLPSAR